MTEGKVLIVAGAIIATAVGLFGVATLDFVASNMTDNAVRLQDTMAEIDAAQVRLRRGFRQ